MMTETEGAVEDWAVRLHKDVRLMHWSCLIVKKQNLHCWQLFLKRERLVASVNVGEHAMVDVLFADAVVLVSFNCSRD